MWNTDLAESQRLSFALESKENAAVAAQWAPKEPNGSLLPFVDTQFKVESTYDAFAATCSSTTGSAGRSGTPLASKSTPCSLR